MGIDNLCEPNDLHPCCRSIYSSIDYMNLDLKQEKNFKEFLSDVYEVGKETAVHKWNPGWFKYCRAGFGELDLKIDFKRANKFLNEFNWIIQVAFRCNHDIWFLGD